MRVFGGDPGSEGAVRYQLVTRHDTTRHDTARSGPVNEPARRRAEYMPTRLADKRFGVPGRLMWENAASGVDGPRGACEPPAADLTVLSAIS